MKHLTKWGGGASGDYPQECGKLPQNETSNVDTKTKKRIPAIAQIVMWLLVFIIGFATALTFSNALLHSSKTATGAISFDLKSPSISLNNGLKLNYDANVGSFGTLTYGDSAYDILNLDALDLSIDNGNLLSKFYVKLIYDFTSLAGTVSFAQNAYDFGSAKMSTMTSTGTKNEFYTISSSNGNPNSPTTVTKSDTNKFNVLTFLRDFQYINDSALSESTKKFTIVVIVDLNENCNSSSRSQLSMTGTINTNIMSLKFSADGACQVISASGVTSIEIPYKVKLAGDGSVAEIDMQGTATGEGWTTITSIAPNAFSGCTELTTIKNNGSITTIGDNAFAGCTKLSSMELDFTKITSIGRNTTTSTNALSDTAFYKALPYASSNVGTVTYGDILFEYKNQSETLALTNYRVIAPYAFKSQTALTSVTMDSSIQYINNNAFSACATLQTIDMSSYVPAKVESDAFVNDHDLPLIVKVSTTDSTTQQGLTDATILNHIVSMSLTLNINININFWTYIYSCDDTNKYALNEIRQSIANGFTCEKAEKLILISSFTPKIEVGFDNGNSYSEVWVESIACYCGDEKNVVFATNGGTYNHYGATNIKYGASELSKGNENTLNISLECSFYTCFTADSKIQLADGSYKLAKDIEYDDLLLTWNFDEGEFAGSYPVWITKSTKIEKYFHVEFEDGTFVNIIISHRIYSADEDKFAKSIDSMFSQEGHNILKLAVDENGNALTNEKGEFYHTKCKVKKISVVLKEVQVINIVTAYHLNNYINGVLGSTGFSNMYNFTPLDENLKMTHNQEQMAERQNGTDTMYTLEEFDNSIINKNIFQGWRIAELKGIRTISAIETYIKQHYDVAHPLPTDANGNRLYALSTSDGYKTTIKEGDTYTLPTPTAVDGKTFKGWYNNADGKYYQAGDSVEIYVGTHFTARWV